MRAGRLVRLGAALLLGLALTGCWSRIETNELAVVIAFGVDWHAGTYEVTASVLNPRALGTPGNSPSNPTQPAHVLMSGQGSTPQQALADVDNGSSRRMLWGSADVLILGQSLAEHGIGPLMSAITHEPYFRPTTRLIVAHGDARSIFALDNSGLENASGRQIFLMLQNIHRAGTFAWAPHVFDVARWEAEQQRVILLPGIKGQQPPLPQSQAYTIADSAVLQNGRMVGWLPRSEVRIVLWVEGQFVHGQFNVVCPGRLGQQGTVNLYSAGHSVRSLVQGGRLTGFRVRLSGKGSVSQGCAGASQRQMGAAASQAVLEMARQTFQWAQEQHLDVFGLGEMVYRFHPRLWLTSYQGDWPRAFASLPVTLSADIKIPMPGMTR